MLVPLKLKETLLRAGRSSKVEFADGGEFGDLGLLGSGPLPPL